MKNPILTVSGFGAALAAASLSWTPSNDPRPPTPRASGVESILGDKLAPSALGRSWVESMDAVVQRELEHPAPPGVQFVREPRNPNEEEVERQKERAAQETGGNQPMGGGGSIATIGTNFVGPRLGDAGGGWVPPDTCGAVGPNHFVSIVNSNISIWNKTTGARLLNVGQGSFWSTGNLGDGRCVYDSHSGRFILTSDDFSSRVYLAVSMSSDPTGAWFKTSFQTNTAGVDLGSWPDYP